MERLKKSLAHDKHRVQDLWSDDSDEEMDDLPPARVEKRSPRNRRIDLKSSTKRLLAVSRVLKCAGARGAQQNEKMFQRTKSQKDVPDKLEQEFVTKILTSTAIMMKCGSILRHYEEECLDHAASLFNSGMAFRNVASGASTPDTSSFEDACDAWQSRSLAMAAGFVHQAKVAVARVCWQDTVRPALQEETRWREKHDELETRFHKARTEYLQEVVALRDQVRVRGDPESFLDGKSLEVTSFYEPTHSLTPAELEFAEQVVREKLRMIFEVNPSVSKTVDFGQVERLQELWSCHENQELKKKLGQKVKELRELRKTAGAPVAQAERQAEVAFDSMRSELSELRAKRREDERNLRKRQTLIDALKEDHLRFEEDLDECRSEENMLRRRSLQLVEELEVSRARIQELQQGVPESEPTETLAAKKRKSRHSIRTEDDLSSISEIDEIDHDDHFAISENPGDRVLKVRQSFAEDVGQPHLPKTAEQRNVDGLLRRFSQKIQSLRDSLLGSTGSPSATQQLPPGVTQQLASTDPQGNPVCANCRAALQSADLHRISERSDTVNAESPKSLGRARTLEIEADLHQISELSKTVDAESAQSVARVRALEMECARLQQELQSQTLSKAQGAMDEANMLADVMRGFREKDEGMRSEERDQHFLVDNSSSCSAQLANDGSKPSPVSQDDTGARDLETAVQALRAGMSEEMSRLEDGLRRASVGTVVVAEGRVCNMQKEHLAAEVALLHRRVEDLKRLGGEWSSIASSHALEEAQRLLVVLTKKLQSTAAENMRLLELIFAMNSNVREATAALESVPELKANPHIQHYLRRLREDSTSNLPNVFTRLWVDAERRQTRRTIRSSKILAAMSPRTPAVVVEPAPEPSTSAEDVAGAEKSQLSAIVSGMHFAKEDDVVAADLPNQATTRSPRELPPITAVKPKQPGVRTVTYTSLTQNSNAMLPHSTEQEMDWGVTQSLPAASSRKAEKSTGRLAKATVSSWRPCSSDVHETMENVSLQVHGIQGPTRREHKTHTMPGRHRKPEKPSDAKATTPRDARLEASHHSKTLPDVSHKGKAHGGLPELPAAHESHGDLVSNHSPPFFASPRTPRVELEEPPKPHLKRAHHLPGLDS